MRRLIVSLALAFSMCAETRLSIPMDPEQQKKAAEELRSAVQEENFTAILLQGRRSLELYPNNPGVQAPIYAIMSEAASKSGDTAQAIELAQIAKRLDPSVDARIEKLQTGEAATRGGKGEKFAAAMQVFAQSMQAYQQVRAQMQAQRTMPAPPGQPLVPPPGGITYPPVPVGDPNYQPNPAMNAPMPGWAPPPGQPQYAPPAPAQYPAPGGQPQYAPPAQGQYPAPGGQPQYAPPAGAPQYTPPGQPPYPPPAQQPPYPAPGQPQYAPPAQASYPAPGQPQYAPPAGQSYLAPPTQYPQQYGPPGPAPYAMPAYTRPAAMTRGAKAPVYEVIHDHAVIGDKNYFEKSCGALLTVSGSNLTFTATGGEAPRVIPASEIHEIRMNTLVGREFGVFHIATKQGLYISIAPRSANRDDGRAAVDDLRSRLGLSE